MKKFLELAVWVVIIGGILFAAAQLFFYTEELGRRTGDIVPRSLFMVFFPFLMGILLRIPRLLNEKRAGRPWKVQWAKLLLVVLPAGYVPASILFAFLPFDFMLPFTFSFILLTESFVTPIIILICGYALAGSFNSSDEQLG